VIFDEGGTVAGSTLADSARADELARRAGELLQHAASLRGGDALPTQLEVATNEGSVFIARDAKARIVATTSPQPTVGLVFYDLKSALRQIEQAPEPSEEATSAEPAGADEAETVSDAPKKKAAARKKPKPRKKPDAS
jgi:hypothetical protein